MTDPSQWQRMKDLFLAAGELPASARAAFLEAACVGDLQLRERVEALLEAGYDSSSGSLLGSPPEPPMTLETATVGRYRLGARIGSGGMGEVWSAEDCTLGRKAAIKVLRTGLTSDPVWLRRFQREARIVSRLNHPNILTLYEIGQASEEGGSFHYLATELIEGVTLRQRLAGEGRLAPGEALDIAIQVASALKAAHHSGVIHRDIKPENIMIRPDQVVKVLDFGLAKLNPESESQITGHHDTIAGSVIGTPCYMSPERVRGQEGDARTDIFSMGVVLYEMATGRPPFKGESVPDTFAMILKDAPHPLGRETPESLRRTIGRALEKDPASRQASMEEFCAELEAIRNGPEAAPGQPGRKRVIWQAAGAAVAMGLLAAAVTRFGDRNQTANPAAVAPFAAFAGKKDFAAFSPDDSRIAFVWDGGRQREDAPRDIYVRPVGGGDPVRLTATPDDESRPVWSPDNRHIAFRRSNSLYLIPPLPGGAERRLADEAGQGHSWSPDSNVLAMASRTQKDHPGRIWLISANTGERLKELTNPAAPSFDDQPAFSPDGKWIAFLRAFGPVRREVMVIPAAGGDARQVTRDRRQIFGLAWTADGREIVFAANRGGGLALWRIPVRGGSPERIPIPSQNPTYPSISRRGTRLVYTDAYTDSNVYRFEGKGFGNAGVPGRFGEAAPFLNSSREDHSQQFSPDGSQVVFVSVRTGSEELWLCDRTGARLRRLTKMDGPPTGTPRWAPDGRTIAFDTHVTGDGEIFVIDSESGAMRNATNSPSSWEATPGWSADGKWLYFSSNRAGMGSDIWKQPATGGPAARLTYTGAAEGFESPDGKAFYFSKGRGGKGIWSVPVEGGQERLVNGLEMAGYWRSWGVHARGIYFVAGDLDSRQSLWFYSFETKRAAVFMSIGRDALWSHPGISLSADGRDLLLAQKDHRVDDIMLVDNFR